MRRQKIDLIDVEHAAMSFREQAGLENGVALERAFQIQATKDAVFRCADGQIDEASVLGQQQRKPTCGSSFARAFIAAQQNAETPVNRGQQKRELHLLLTDDCREGIDVRIHRITSRLASPCASRRVSLSRRTLRSASSVSGAGFSQSSRLAASSRRSAMACMAHGFERARKSRISCESA